MKKRTFFAFKMPLEFIEFYDNDLFPYLSSINGIKEVKPENCHITLKFLGNTDEHIIEEIKFSVADALKNSDSLFTTLTDFLIFPGFKNPKVLSLGFNDKNNRISNIANILEKAAVPFGFKMESRAFRPHITIGRVKKNLEPLILDNIKQFVSNKMYIGKLKLDVITFFESVLTPFGPVYREISEIPLKNIT